MFRSAQRDSARRVLLQNSIHDLQLPIAARCQTRIVRNDQKRFAAIAREIQQQIHHRVAAF